MAKVLAIGNNGYTEYEVPVLVPVAGTTVPVYTSSVGEIWFLQNSIAQHSIRYMQANGSNGTAITYLGYPAWTHATGATLTGIPLSATNEWTQSPQVASRSTLTAPMVGWYSTIATHFYNDPATNFGHLVSFTFGVGDTQNPNNIRMFIGDTTSTAALSNVDPTTLANAIGLIQSPSAPNANRFYFYINGTGSSPVLIDTGQTMSLNLGYRFTIFSIKNTRKVGLRLVEIVSDTVSEVVVDMATLFAGQIPTPGAYASRMQRSAAFAPLVGDIRLEFSKVYLEMRN